MRWVTYQSGNVERAGLVVGDKVHGLADGETVVGLLGDDGERMAAAAERATDDPVEVVDLATAPLAPPVRPLAIRDFLAFHGHLRNAMGPDVPLDERHFQFPAFYFSNPAAVKGPYDEVAMAPGSAMFDYELEIGAVIGRTATNVSLDEADACIAGYTIFCDWSARDIQGNEMALQAGAVKSKDTANTLGPVLVTADELEPYRSAKGFNLEMRGYVNDELVSQGCLDQLDWTFADMVTYAARGTTLRPGDVIGSGTVPTGCLLEHFVMDTAGFRGWLKSGDVIRLDVQELGTIRNTVVEALPHHPLSSGF